MYNCIQHSNSIGGTERANSQPHINQQITFFAPAPPKNAGYVQTGESKDTFEELDTKEARQLYSAGKSRLAAERPTERVEGPLQPACMLLGIQHKQLLNAPIPWSKF